MVDGNSLLAAIRNTRLLAQDTAVAETPRETRVYWQRFQHGR
jgi:hypothetical protein